MTESPAVQFDPAAQSGPHQQLSGMLFGYWVSQALRTIADLSIADHLAGGALTADELAAREGTAPDTTYRLMRAAVGLGLLTADGGGRFHPTPLLDPLRSDHPQSLRPLVMALTSSSHWLPWRDFSTAVRSGQSQVKATFGMNVFEYFDQHPAEQREFSAGMSSLTTLWGGGVVPFIDTATVKLAVDIGGANGTFLHSLQEANPELHGIIFDRPTVAADVAAQLARSPFADRTEVVGGDFFDSVPAADLYLLKFILHDWNDAACVAILRRCREAMLPGGRIAIIELVIGDLHDPGVGALMDLDMLAMTDGGRERSVAEFDVLLTAAGLRRTSVQTTGSPHHLVEAVAC